MLLEPRIPFGIQEVQLRPKGYGPSNFRYLKEDCGDFEDCRAQLAIRRA